MGFVMIGLIVLAVWGLWYWDRRTRRKGHTLRTSAAMRRSELDVRRNIRAGKATGHNPVDKDWNKPDERRS